MALTYPSSFLSQDGGLVVRSGELQYPAGGATPQHVRSYAFTYTTAGLATGVTIYTPTVGEVIYDIGVCITTAFDGTTPKLDVGTFTGNDGLFKTVAGAVLDGTKLYAAVTSNAGLTVPNAAQWLQAATGSAGAAAGAAYVSAHMIVTVANPIKLVASQSGAKGGTAINSTVGAGTVYVLLGQPLSF